MHLQFANSGVSFLAGCHSQGLVLDAEQGLDVSVQLVLLESLSDASASDNNFCISRTVLCK